MTKPAELTIYHNPRCSKSRATLRLLREQGISPQVIEYLKTPPDAATLRHLLELLGMKPHDLLRTNEDIYRELDVCWKESQRRRNYPVDDRASDTHRTTNRRERRPCRSGPPARECARPVLIRRSPRAIGAPSSFPLPLGAFLARLFFHSRGESLFAVSSGSGRLRS